LWPGGASTNRRSACAWRRTSISPTRPLAPLERIALREVLDGSGGLNRSPAFPYIHAHNDRGAARVWLLYRNRPKTPRAYTREIERFPVWAVTVRGKALSSLLVDDGEAYKDYSAQRSPSFVGACASPRT
jgi:hypothetical protein